MLLTLGDMSSNPIKIHGPKGTNSFLKSNRFFITRNPNLKEHVVEWNDSDVFKNESIEIVPILISFDDSNDSNDSNETNETKNSKERKERKDCISYIIQGPTKPGKFNPTKAKKLKLDPALHYKKLIQGESVELSNGTLVHPNECVSEKEDGKRFVIIECPSKEYIPNLSLKLTKETLGDVCLMIHNLGEDILENSEYIQWLKSLDLKDNVQHLIFSPGYCHNALTFPSTSKVLKDLSGLNSKIFKPPFESFSSLKSIDSVSLNRVTLGKLLQVFEFEPRVFLNESLCPFPPNTDLFVQENQEIEEIEETQETQERKERYKDVKIIPLGTGSSMPSKYRNVSSTFISLPHFNMLLDCGEGTLGQMFRHFGPNEFKTQLSRLQLLFISHLHADHHLGTVRVLLETLKYNPRLYLIAPGPFWTFLNEYSSIQNIYIDKIQFIDSKYFLRDTPKEFSHNNKKFKNSKIQKILENLNLKDITTVQVDHCPLAYGIVLETIKNQIKISYSGDCRPSMDLIQIGKDSDILIHEATFDDNMIQDAIKKMHCTQQEAILVAKGYVYFILENLTL